MKKAVVLLSGGLDSATTAAIAIAEGYQAIALSFRYGQRHHKELEAAKKIAKTLKIHEHFVIDVNLSQWGGSSLTDESMEIPQAGLTDRYNSFNLRTRQKYGIYWRSLYP